MRTHRFLVINPRSGRGTVGADGLAEAARELGIETHVLSDGEDPGELARASGAEILGVVLDLFTLGARARLDEGVLELRAAAGWWPTTWQEQVAERFRIELPHGSVRAAIDGEPLPQALRVLLPQR